MRASALSKIAVLAAVAGVALSFSSTASTARMMKPAPGSCVADKRMIVAGGMVCSYHCDRATQWCQQGWCLNGVWTPIVSCYEPVCSAKCGAH
jgi:hypothetical protein